MSGHVRWLPAQSSIDLWVRLWAQMARRLNLLSPKFVETIEKPGRYADGGGLYLQVAASRNGGVTKSWLFRYMRGHLSRTGNPTSREMGLGPLSTNKRDGFITTKEARDRAYRAREDLKAGIDPIESRQALRTARKLNEARSVTFSQCAAEYIESHKASWKGDKHVKLWKGSLGRYAEPVIGNLPVAAIDTALVLKVLKPIWETKTKTAVDVRLRIELILNWAKTHGYRDGENPARWKGHIKNALPDPSKVAKVKHLAAMPYDELPGFMGKLRAETGTPAAALEWTILTAVRSDNTFAATWPEIDLREEGLGHSCGAHEGRFRPPCPTHRSDDRNSREAGTRHDICVRGSEPEEEAASRENAEAAEGSSPWADRSRVPINLQGLGIGGNGLRQ